MQRRSAQGLCFNCNEKLSSGRRCKGPQLLLLEVNFDAEAEEDNNETNPDFPSNLEVSLHALTGWTTEKTMRVTTKIGNYEVVVLIDSSYLHIISLVIRWMRCYSYP